MRHPSYLTLLLIPVLAIHNVRAQTCSLSGGFSLELQDECSLDALQAAFDDFIAAPENQILSSVGSCASTDLSTLLNGQDVSKLCDEATSPGELSFEDIVQQKDGKFVDSFFRGKTFWNEEVQTNYDLDDPNGPAVNILKEDLQHIPDYKNVLEHTKLAYPSELENFNLENSCAMNAVMCCWPVDRQANDNNGNCNTPYDTNCIDKDPADNTDLCGVHLDRGNYSNNLDTADGFTVFENDNNDGEGAIHCHGLAYSNDASDAETRYMGNNLFFVSMFDHLYQRGYAREVPGAPMCGCVEQMPVVTRSDCTQVDVTETFTFDYDPLAGFSVTVSDVDIEFNACQGLNNNNNDLSAYVARLETEGKVTLAQKNELKKYLVENGNCDNAIERNLASKGISRGFSPDYYDIVVEFPATETSQFVHGICVVGATEAHAFSDTDDNLFYQPIPNFQNGEKLWGDRTYTVTGVEEAGLCEGGIFLQPNLHKAIDTFTDITVGANSNGNDDLSICVMLFDNDSRNGGWIDFLTENRFLPRVGPTSLNGENVLKEFNTYCKTFPEDKYDPDITYTFPSPNGERFTHGLCVMGATTAFAYSSDPDLHYSMIPDFKDGVRGWSDRTYKYTGVNGPEMCEGGMYLRPSVIKSGIDAGTEIVLEATSLNGSVTACMFLYYTQRAGLDEFVLNGSYMESQRFGFDSKPDVMTSYCKTLPQEPTAAPIPVLLHEYVEHFPATSTNEFIHAICVLGASTVDATSSDPDLQYTVMRSSFQNGTKLWDDRTYTVDNVVGEELCQGGTYLRPSTVKVIDKGTEISVGVNTDESGEATICVLLFENDHRDGGWPAFLSTNGFSVTTGPLPMNGNSAIATFETYCKTYPGPPTAAPIPIASYEYSQDFPATSTNELIHAICVLGASAIDVSSTDPDLSYFPIADFQDGEKLWGDRTYTVDNVVGEELCQGGTYLRPSTVKVIDKGTEISVGVNTDESGEATICVLLFRNDVNRDGGWPAFLTTNGFSVTTGPLPMNGNSAIATFKTYCKRYSS